MRMRRRSGVLLTLGAALALAALTVVWAIGAGSSQGQQGSPPYTQEDLDQLAAMGANYVTISPPGLCGEAPPYALDEDVQDNLDSLLGMIAEADMFAVISFRTGPGRSEFTFYGGDWFDESYLNDSVWQDQSAQDAWV